MNGLYLIGCSIWAFLDITEGNSENNVHESSSSFPAIVAIIGVSVITLAVICWTLMFFCTDCYNAEVDSMNHPACQSQGIGIAVSGQATQQDEGQELNKYLHAPPTQQPLHLHQYHAPASNLPTYNPYSNLNSNSHCSNICPTPSAPNMGQVPPGYQNYQGQGHNSMHGYNHQSMLPPPPSYSSFS